MPEHNPGQMGGTMRLGKRRTIFKSPSSVLRKRPEPGGGDGAASPADRLFFQANSTETPSTWRSGTGIASR